MMRNEIIESSTVAAAEAVRSETIAMWEQAEREAGNLAYAIEGSDGMDAVMAKWVAETDAMRARPLMAWQVYETPDDGNRRWYLAKKLPEAAVSELEAIEHRTGGGLVVAPGDDRNALVRKLKDIRSRGGAEKEGARL